MNVTNCQFVRSVVAGARTVIRLLDDTQLQSAANAGLSLVEQAIEGHPVESVELLHACNAIQAADKRRYMDPTAYATTAIIDAIQAGEAAIQGAEEHMLFFAEASRSCVRRAIIACEPGRWRPRRTTF